MFESIHARRDVSKSAIRDEVLRELSNAGFHVADGPQDKPWGVELRIAQYQTTAFMSRAFSGARIPDRFMTDPVGPKLLLIQGERRLSWHVHERKDAFLRVLRGMVDVTVSPNDHEPAPVPRSASEIICIPPRMRHRLASTAGWAIVAEIAIDADPARPSDDGDIRRISDDYGRAL